MNMIFIALVIFASVLETRGDCNVEGVTVQTGPFDHPEDSCKACFCCEKGGYTCKYKEYARPMCGINKQETDGCGITCSSECDSAQCTIPNYPEERMAFEPNSCCPSKGCSLTDGNWTFPVTPQGEFGSCGRCVCKPSGEWTCDQADCSERLECVDPVAKEVDGACQYSCPNGTTCRRSGVILRPNEFTQIGFLVCTCVTGPNWYPRGFCMKPTEVNDAVKLAQDFRCAADGDSIQADEEPFKRIDYANFLQV